MITELGLLALGFGIARLFGGDASKPATPSRAQWPSNVPPGSHVVRPDTRSQEQRDADRMAAAQARPLTHEEQQQAQSVLERGGFYGPKA